MEEGMRSIDVAAACFLSVALVASLPGASIAGQKKIVGTAGAAKVLLEPRVSYAGTTLECGNKSYHVTTGSKAGKCESIMSADGTKKLGVACKDGGGNYGGATCGEGCLNSSGAGDCTLK
jgi:hypothetical protein